MGKPTQPPTSERSQADDAISLHTTRDDYEYDDAPQLPPSYNESVASNTDASSSEPLLSADPYAPTEPAPSAQGSSAGSVQVQGETSIRLDVRLTDPDELQNHIQKYLAVVPPNQLIRIKGTHKVMQCNPSTKKNETTIVTDFDFIFSLQSYLKREEPFWSVSGADNRDKVYRGGFIPSSATEAQQDIELADTPTLQDWCRVFCSDRFALKVFRVTRDISGLDTEELRSAIERLVRSTHYYGRLEISFPVENRYIDIYSPHWINKARFLTVRYFFYLTFLWLITWPILFFATKWWSVYTVRWSWSRSDEQQPTRKVYASISEREWVERHTNLIKSLVLQKFKGDPSAFPVDVPEEIVSRGINSRRPADPVAWGGDM